MTKTEELQSLTVSGEQSVFLSDTTLRDGEQSFGIVFNDKERVRLAIALSNAGVTEIEAGFPSLPHSRTGYLDTLVRLRASGALNSRLLGWHRPVPAEVVHSADRGLDGCAISVPSSGNLIRDVLGRTEDWVIDQMCASVDIAKRRGLYVVADFQDAFAAQEDFLTNLSRAMRDAGADRIRLCDTVGRSTPVKVVSTMQSLIEQVEIDLELHAHNDLGLAVANALAAVELWKTTGTSRNLYIACTVNGLGERTGNTPLEVIAAAAAETSGLTLMDLTQLAPLCELVADMVNRPIPVNAPVVGLNNWRHASGLHVDGLSKSASSYELINPTDVGYSEDIRVLTCGQYGGRAALRTYLAQLKLNVADCDQERLLDMLALEIVARKRYLTVQETEQLCEQINDRQTCQSLPSRT